MTPSSSAPSTRTRGIFLILSDSLIWGSNQSPIEMRPSTVAFFMASEIDECMGGITVRVLSFLSATIPMPLRTA